MLQRPIAIKVSVVNDSQKDRRAAEKQRRRNEEKKKEAGKREETSSKRSKSIILMLLKGKCSKSTETLIFHVRIRAKQKQGKAFRGSASFEDRRFQLRSAANSANKLKHEFREVQNP